MQPNVPLTTIVHLTRPVSKDIAKTLAHWDHRAGVMQFARLLHMWLHAVVHLERKATLVALASQPFATIMKTAMTPKHATA